MTQEELDYNITEMSEEWGIPSKMITPIPKINLVKGVVYPGNCRNSDWARWNGENFEYLRYKFGTYYTDHINHYEDDDGYDVFVPVKID